MKKKLVLIGMFAFFAAGGYLFAGQGSTFTTFVSADNGAASRLALGSLQATRNSADANEYIRCAVYSDNTATCSAKDPEGDTLSGSTDNVDIVNAVRSISGDAVVLFYVDTATGDLTSVDIHHSSEYLQ